MDIKNSRYIVNGAHEEARLQDLLDGFIKKFVLCPECENPETHLVRWYNMFSHVICYHCIWVWCILIGVYFVASTTIILLLGILVARLILY